MTFNKSQSRTAQIILHFRLPSYFLELLPLRLVMDMEDMAEVMEDMVDMEDMDMDMDMDMARGLLMLSLNQQL